MKIYAVCKECDDSYYGCLAPEKVFKNKDDAKVYAKELFDDGYTVVVKEYELVFDLAYEKNE